MLHLLLSIVLVILDNLDWLYSSIVVFLFGKRMLPFDCRKTPSAVYPLSVLLPKTEEENSTPIIRRKGYDKKLVNGVLCNGQVSTIHGLMKWAAEKYKQKRLHGVRVLEEIETKEIQTPDGPKTWYTPVFRETGIWYSYEEVYRQIQILALHLVHLKLKPGDRAAIYLPTCQEWFLFAHACFLQKIQVVTIYDTLGEDALIDCLNQTQSKALLIPEEMIFRTKDPIEKVLIEKCASLHVIIAKETVEMKKETSKQSQRESARERINHFCSKIKEDVKIYYFRELQKVSNIKEEIPFPISDADDVALMMFTSGTTGTPKAVQITHSNLLATVKAVHECALTDELVLDYIGFLPLAHILELVVEHLIIYRGGSIGWGSSKTLTEKSAKPIGDLGYFKPTVLVGVPRIFTTIQKTVTEVIQKSSPITRQVFEKAYKSKLKAVYEQRDTFLWNYLVFRKFANVTGGRLSAVLCGASAISKETQEFIRVTLGTPFLQGYGLSETCAASAIQSLTDPFSPVKVGSCMPSVEVKLIDIPEMGYTHADKPNPRGEIAVRGNSVCMNAYYELPELTKEAFDLQTGWFRTGDIGAYDVTSGELAIVDRKKNLVKLSHGEYVAVEKLQSIYQNSPFVEANGIYVHAEPSADYLVAVVVVRNSYLKDWINQHLHQQVENVKEYCKNEKVQQAVLESLKQEAKRSKLQNYEKIYKLYLVDDTWTVENGLLTAANKLKRNSIYEKYQSQIQSMIKG